MRASKKDERTTAAAKTPKRVYTKPELKVIGSVKELTEGTVVTGGDAFLTGTTAS